MKPAQLAVLRADVIADPVLSLIPRNDDGYVEIAKAYNAPASPDFLVWRSDTPVRDIIDAITWSAYTPNDTPDNTATFTNRALVIQTKQMNLQLMLQGRQNLDTTKPNIRSAIRDAVINLPSGVSGASVTAGGASGVTVLTACLRKATRGEKLFASGTATTGSVTGNLMVIEGQISTGDISQAMSN